MNVDTLCFTCHMKFEGNKQGTYRDWMLGRLGEEEYLALQERAYSVVKCGKHEREIIHKHLLKEGLEGLEELLEEVLK